MHFLTRLLELWNAGLRLVDPTARREYWNIGFWSLHRPESLWAGSGLEEDIAILGKWSAKGGTIEFKMDNILL
jgi:hypothetical protein